MRILIIASDSYGSWGGVQLVNRVLVKAFEELLHPQNATIECLSLNDRGVEYSDDSVVVRVESRGFNGSKLKFSLSVVRRLALHRYDLVLVTFLNIGLVPYLSSYVLPRVRYQVLIHGLEAWKPLSALLLRTLFKAERILSNSNYTWGQVVRHNPALADRVATVLPLCLDPDLSIGGTTRLGEQTVHPALLSKKQILIVGRMWSSERGKGHDQLIEAMAKVVAIEPQACLVIVGEGDDRGRLEREARNLGDAVYFTGAVDLETLHELYKNCAVFAMPSTQEGFGLVFLEAMAHGKPCVAVCGSVAEEILVDGETGVLVKQQDIDGIAKALIRLLRDPRLRMQMGAAGKTRVVENFSFESFKQRVSSHFLESEIR